MPSAKVEKQAPAAVAAETPANNTAATGDPLKQVQSLVEKKIRNLEKRKTKLENLQVELQNGKDLTESQRKAVEKLEDVDENLDFFRDFSKTVNTIFQDANKERKKQAKQEQLERQRQDIERIKTILLFQRLVIEMNEGKSKKDFSNGTNGATKLEKERLDQLEALHKIVTPDPKGNESAVKQIDSIADHLIALQDGKNREAVSGATYKELKETLVTIKETRYFDRKQEVKQRSPKSNNRAPNGKQPVAAQPSEPIINDQAGQVHLQSLQPAPVQHHPMPTHHQQPLLHLQNAAPQVQFLQDSALTQPSHPYDPAIVSIHAPGMYPTVFSATPAPAAPVTENGDGHLAGQKFDDGAPIPTQTFINGNYGGGNRGGERKPNNNKPYPRQYRQGGGNYQKRPPINKPHNNYQERKNQQPHLENKQQQQN